MKYERIKVPVFTIDEKFVLGAILLNYHDELDLYDIGFEYSVFFYKKAHLTDLVECIRLARILSLHGEYVRYYRESYRLDPKIIWKLSKTKLSKIVKSILKKLEQAEDDEYLKLNLRFIK